MPDSAIDHPYYDLRSNGMVWLDTDKLYLAWSMKGPELVGTYAGRIKVGYFNPVSQSFE